MADIRRDIGMAKENWPPAIRAALLQPNAPNILFESCIRYILWQTVANLDYHRNGVARVRKNENFPDSMIFVAKTFRIKRVICIIFQIRDKYA